MSITAADIGQPAEHPSFGGSDPMPRVRHLAREAVVLMTFSAVTSSAFAGCLLLLSTLGRRG